MSTYLYGLNVAGLTNVVGVRMRNSDNAFWNTATPGFEAYNASNIANYAITASQIGSSGIYQFADPSPGTAGQYLMVTKAGASLAVTDLVAGLFWQVDIISVSATLGSGAITPATFSEAMLQLLTRWLVSTGTTSPATADTYTVAGFYNGTPYYQSNVLGTQMFVWSNGSGYTISAVVGTNGSNYFTSSGSTANGTYTAQGGASGTATVVAHGAAVLSGFQPDQSWVGSMVAQSGDSYPLLGTINSKLANQTVNVYGAPSNGYPWTLYVGDYYDPSIGTGIGPFTDNLQNITGSLSGATVWFRIQQKNQLVQQIQGTITGSSAPLSYVFPMLPCNLPIGNYLYSVVLQLAGGTEPITRVPPAPLIIAFR